MHVLLKLSLFEHEIPHISFMLLRKTFTLKVKKTLCRKLNFLKRNFKKLILFILQNLINKKQHMFYTMHD